MANTLARAPIIPSLPRVGARFTQAQVDEAQNVLPGMFPPGWIPDASYYTRPPLVGTHINWDIRRTFSVYDNGLNLCTAAGTANVTLSGVGSAIGDATAAGIGFGAAPMAGTATGDATAAGIGIGRAPMVGSAAGDSTAAAVGFENRFPFKFGTAATCERPPLDKCIRRTITVLDTFQNMLPATFRSVSGVGTATGDATVSAVTAALKASVGAASGDATAAATSAFTRYPFRDWGTAATCSRPPLVRSIRRTISVLDVFQNRLPILFEVPGKGRGDAVGDATAAAVSRALAKSAGTAAGDSIAAAISSATAQSAGLAIGDALARAVGRGFKPVNVIQTVTSVRRALTSVGAGRSAATRMGGQLSITGLNQASRQTDIIQEAAFQADAFQTDAFQTQTLTSVHNTIGHSATTVRTNKQETRVF